VDAGRSGPLRTEPDARRYRHGGLSIGNNRDLAAERDRLNAEVLRLQVSRDTGVPAELLTPAATEDSARALAERLLAWKGEAAPPPTPSEPFYPVTQYRREDLAYRASDEIAQAYREGRLAQIGALAPQHDGGRP
jgi:hypothetical protein